MTEKSLFKELNTFIQNSIPHNFELPLDFLNTSIISNQTHLISAKNIHATASVEHKSPTKKKARKSLKCVNKNEEKNRKDIGGKKFKKNLIILKAMSHIVCPTGFMNEQ